MNGLISTFLDVEIPILAFSHCRDVVAAVSRAGGFGVFGAQNYTPEELDRELTWIDEHVNGAPYGVDVLIPERFVGKGESLTPEELEARVPATTKAFIRGIFAEHGIEISDIHDEYLAKAAGLVGDEVSDRLLDVAFSHPIGLIANALGVPPQFMIDEARSKGVPIAALVGAKEHAIRQVQAGVDIIIASGTEAGGHTGQVTTMVLVPEVIEAIAEIRPVPVLAAGGITTGRQVAAAIALGAAGAWTGSVWLTTNEAETSQAIKEKMLAASSRDTVLTKARTGKTSRMLRSAFTEAWDRPDAPPFLGMPLQYVAADPHLRRIERLADAGDEGARELVSYWVGQGVGLMHSIRPAETVLLDMAGDLVDASERLHTLLGE